MDLGDIISIYDKIKERWETKAGFAFTLIIILILYYFLSDYFNLNVLIENTYVLKLFIPLGLLILIFIFWIYRTNRFFIKSSNKITAGIVIIFENDLERIVINKIIRKILREINKSNAYSNVNLKILPSNILQTDIEVEKYHDNFNFMYDLIIRIFVDSGNFNSIEKILIEKFSVTFRSINRKSSKVIFSDAVDVSKDMALQVQARNWEYFLSNSGEDKKKYLINIHQVLIYYLGLYAIYSDRYEDALQIMSSIYDKSKTIVKVHKKQGEQITINLKPDQIAHGRLSATLVNLFFYNALLKYRESKTQEALNYLTELEKLIDKHPLLFDQYINIARFSYEMGDINRAIEYTDKASKIKPNAIQVYLNNGFFAILNEDIHQFCFNYSKMYNLRNQPGINWVDVLEFQLNQQKQLKNKNKFFNFSTLFIEYIFLDEDKKGQFEKMVEEYKDLKELRCIYILGESILKTTDYSYIKTYKRNLTKFDKKKKRKKKR